MDPWSCAHCYTFFDTSESLVQGNILWYLVSVNKTPYKVSASVVHMVLPPGKAKLYLEYISVPAEMIHCPFQEERRGRVVLKDNAVRGVQAGPGWTCSSSSSHTSTDEWEPVLLGPRRAPSPVMKNPLFMSPLCQK